MNNETFVAPATAETAKMVSDILGRPDTFQNVVTEVRDGKEVLVVLPNTRLLTTKEQEEFEALSLKVFGATSRWATLLKKGLVEAVTEEVEEYVPAQTDKDGNVTKSEETRKVQVPVYYRSEKRGLTTIPLLRRVNFTPETLMTYMLDLKEKQDKIRAMLQKMADERKAKEDAAKLESQVAEQVAGSVM